jgi:DNA-directed RNA polymerase subunit RPC12/RpoP
MEFFFGKRKPKQPQQSSISAGLPKTGDAISASLKAHSRFIKRVSCPQCGAPKSRPSTTAYIYCDYCGSLMDYDFRLANANTNAGITNTVYHRIMATVQFQLIQAKARGDRDEVRRIKDMDPHQATLQAKMDGLVARLQRIPTPGGAWMVAGPFWEYAALFKEQMEGTYALIRQHGADQLDPDHALPEIALRMEYSTFCQAWLPHLSPTDGERLLKFYGLNSEYDDVKPHESEQRHCGSCGSDIETLPGAKQVVCESCGFTLDVAGMAVPCQKCGASLSFPVGIDQVVCPYCSTDTRRV